eukprot:6196031-Pleurochrysis_carterae.AAC.3
MARRQGQRARDGRHLLRLQQRQARAARGEAAARGGARPSFFDIKRALARKCLLWISPYTPHVKHHKSASAPGEASSRRSARTWTLSRERDTCETLTRHVCLHAS